MSKWREIVETREEAAECRRIAADFRRRDRIWEAQAYDRKASMLERVANDVESLQPPPVQS